MSFNALRNPVRFGRHDLRCVEAFATFGWRVRYVDRDVELGTPPDLSAVRADIDAVVAHWAARGVEAGSEEALLVEG